MSGPPASSASASPRAVLWLTGAAALALAVQAIFLLAPEPKSAGATDPAAPEAAASLDSTAFLLEEDASTLPAADTVAVRDTLTTKTVDSVRAVVEPAPVSEPAAELASPAVEELPADSATTPQE